MKVLTLKEVKLVSGGTFNICKPSISNVQPITQPTVSATTVPSVSVSVPSVSVSVPKVTGSSISTSKISWSYNIDASGSTVNSISITF
ncbi:hypothetical protein ACWKA6_000096 [Providencia stuartii]|uniref:hypothetical protein n=1 Tax=Providencia stuartii TaxID=588 RepID=UPI0037EE74DF